MRKALAMTMGLSLLLTGVSGLVIGAPTTKPAESPKIDVNLNVPEGTRLHDLCPRMTLDISPEKKLAVVAVSKPPTMSDPGRDLDLSVMVADLKTGKLSPVANLVPKSQEGRAAFPQLSPDGKTLLVVWMVKKDWAVYAIALPEGKAVKLAEGRAIGTWAGDKVAVSTMSGEGMPKLGKINMVDPTTGKGKELPVRGIVHAGLPDGTLLVGGNPKDPAAEISIEDATAKGRLFHVSADGKVLDDVGPVGIVSSLPVVSGNGKFMAFQSKPADSPEGPGTKYGFTIMSVDGKSKIELTTAYFPIAVMDDGSAVVISNESDLDGQAPVSWVSKDGKTVKELTQAVSATVIGKSLIYTVNKEKPTIKTMPLPAK